LKVRKENSAFYRTLSISFFKKYTVYYTVYYVISILLELRKCCDVIAIINNKGRVLYRVQSKPGRLGKGANFQKSQGKSGKVLSQGKRYCFLVKSQGKK